MLIKLLLAFLTFVVVTFLVMFITQSYTWSTGRGLSRPLVLNYDRGDVVRPDRLWVDTDAACGATSMTDPDDCFAIVWL